MILPGVRMLWRWLSQPEGCLGWLHCLLNHREQTMLQLVQVNLIAQGSAKGCQRMGRVVSAPIEALVDETLNARTERLE
jgi:hypothetical protein